MGSLAWLSEPSIDKASIQKYLGFTCVGYKVSCMSPSDTSINPNCCWLFVIFLSSNALCKLPLLSEWLDDSYRCNTPQKSVFQMTCPQIEPATPACQFCEAEITFPLGHSASPIFVQVQASWHVTGDRATLTFPGTHILSWVASRAHIDFLSKANLKIGFNSEPLCYSSYLVVQYSRQ